MSTEKDALAQIINKALGDVTGIYDTSNDEDLGIADALLAAGYRKQEVVNTTAAEEAMRRYNGDVDHETGACVDDWGYSEGERRAFVAGALFESHKQRNITTVAELDALPVGAIVLDSTDSDWRKVDYSSSTAGTDHRWATAGWEVAYSAKEVELPATLIHTPEGDN